MRTRITPPPSVAAGRHAARRRGSRRHLEPHRRPLAGPRGDREAAAQLRRPLLHRRQSEPPAADLRRRSVEPAPVVGHAQRHAAAAVLEPDLDPPGVRVPERVLQRLLRDPEHLTRGDRAERRRRADAQIDIPPRHAPQHVDVLAQRRRQPLGLQGRGPQLEHN
jgi:hypothetical protein